MTKRDLVVRISKETGIIQEDVHTVMQKTLDYITEALAKGEHIEFRDFGVFEIRNRAPRVAQNPKTLERVPVPAKRTVKFKVGRLMKMALEDRGFDTSQLTSMSMTLHENGELHTEDGTDVSVEVDP